MKKYKLLLTHYYTKCDVNGNIYHAVAVESFRTGKAFTVSTPSLSNVESILRKAFGGWEESRAITREVPTGSARLSSLPEREHLNPCHFDQGWKQALNGIGFRLPKANS